MRVYDYITETPVDTLQLMCHDFASTNMLASSFDEIFISKIIQEQFNRINLSVFIGCHYQGSAGSIVTRIYHWAFFWSILRLQCSKSEPWVLKKHVVTIWCWKDFYKNYPKLSRESIFLANTARWSILLLPKINVPFTQSKDVIGFVEKASTTFANFKIEEVRKINNKIKHLPW